MPAVNYYSVKYFSSLTLWHYSLGMADTRAMQVVRAMSWGGRYLNCSILSLDHFLQIISSRSGANLCNSYLANIVEWLSFKSLLYPHLIMMQIIVDKIFQCCYLCVAPSGQCNCVHWIIVSTLYILISVQCMGDHGTLETAHTYQNMLNWWHLRNCQLHSMDDNEARDLFYRVSNFLMATTCYIWTRMIFHFTIQVFAPFLVLTINPGFVTHLC